ncbi:MAG: AAA family ATPase [Bacteroidaceae bacterium]|nr:AAA family ATPase [Bacteroidaceae bacterium]
MDKRQLIMDELSKAGTDAVLEARLKQLEVHRISAETTIEPKQFLFRMFGTPCFPRGELVAITGKKKCGKTFLCSILMTLCSRRHYMSMSRIEESKLNVLWIDTEQSEETTQEILVQRILPSIRSSHDTERTGTPDADEWNGTVFNLRAVSWNERLSLIEIAARKYRPDLIIFDGIRDVVNDINDGVMAQEVVERTMRLASELQCCICCILHQNKSLEDKTLRGALGTELGNKCFEEYECRKDPEYKVIECTQVSTRKYDNVDKLSFKVGDDGLPHLLSAEEKGRMSQPIKQNVAVKQAEPVRKINAQYLLSNGLIDYVKAFRELLPPGIEKRAGQLESEFVNLVGLNQGKEYGFLRLKALNGGIIRKREEGQKCVLYSIAESLPDDTS